MPRVRCVRALRSVRFAFAIAAFGACVRALRSAAFRRLFVRSGVAFGLRSVPRVRCRAFGLRSAPDAKVWRFMGQVFLRNVMVYDIWPWPLAQLVNDNASDETRQQVATALWHSRSCCTPATDGLTWPLRVLMREPHELLTDEVKALLRDVFVMTPPTNVITEDRFGRSKRHMMTAQGRAPAPPTIASDHCLSEHRAMYSKALESWQEHGTLQADEAHKRRSRNHTWNCFVATRCSGQKRPPALHELGAEWRAMSKEARELFAEQPLPKLSAPLAAPIPPEMTPFELGDDDWPIALRHIKQIRETPGGVKAFSKQWVETTAGTIKPTAEIVAPQRPRCCAAVFGIGSCRQSVEKAHADAVEEHLGLLQRLAAPRWSGSREVPSDLPGALVPHLALVRLQPQEGNSSVRFLLLLTTALQRPATPVFHHFSPANVGIGGIAGPCKTGCTGFARATELAAAMAQAGCPFCIELLHYEWITLDQLRVKGIEDITEALRFPRRCAKKRDPEFDLVKNWGKVRKKCSNPKRPQAGGDDDQVPRRRSSRKKTKDDDYDITEDAGHMPDELGGDELSSGGDETEHDETHSASVKKRLSSCQSGSLYSESEDRVDVRFKLSFGNRVHAFACCAAGNAKQNTERTACALCRALPLRIVTTTILKQELIMCSSVHSLNLPLELNKKRRMRRSPCLMTRSGNLWKPR